MSAIAADKWVSARPGASLAHPASVLDTPTGVVRVAVPISGTALLPGAPAVGTLRVYDSLVVTPTAFVAPGARLELFGPVTPLIRVWVSVAFSHSLVVRPGALAFEEQLRFVNGAATDVTLYATYKDILAGNVSLVRTVLGLDTVPVIPTPPTGFVRRWLQFGESSLQSALRGFGSRVALFNADTVTHNVETLQDGFIVVRANQNAGLPMHPAAIPQLIALPTMGSIEMRVAEAVVTMAPTLIGAYETLPL